MQIIQHPSPNFDERHAPISMLILHYTGMQTGKAALERLCDPQAKVSAHYLVEKDGEIFQLVQEDKRAWHAGVASWCGHQDINARSIGIEIVNPGHEWGYRAFPKAQIDSVAALSKEIIARYKISAHDVVGHSDVAFRRKQDPGELFDWEGLAEQEIGLWPVFAKPKADFKPLQHGSAGERVRQLQECLVQYGYDMPVEGLFGPVTKLAVEAFQRHFRPAQVDGVWDGDCHSRLEELLELV